MTRDEVLAWLDARRPVPPETLREHLRGAVHDAPLGLDAHLAELGRELLAKVASRPAGGRELALDLLAADAFVTYAFEAQAEEGPLHET
ncbi:MAG TPA: hypothetical protein VGQ48_11445 [Gemmatimonadales bacterium]|jgi:hypothetical protein|nr:hypothetical protein [Gemmatimonadales bacterium]